MSNYLIFHGDTIIAECIHLSTVRAIISVIMDDPFRDKIDYYKVTRNNKVIYSIIAYPEEV